MSIQKVFGTQDVGLVVKRARARSRLSQADLADHAGVSRGVVQKLEQGRGTVALENILRILHVLSLDLAIEPRSTAERSPDD